MPKTSQKNPKQLPNSFGTTVLCLSLFYIYFLLTKVLVLVSSIHRFPTLQRTMTAKNHGCKAPWLQSTMTAKNNGMQWLKRRMTAKNNDRKERWLQENNDCKKTMTDCKKTMTARKQWLQTAVLEGRLPQITVFSSFKLPVFTEVSQASFVCTTSTCRFWRKSRTKARFHIFSLQLDHGEKMRRATDPKPVWFHRPYTVRRRGRSLAHIQTTAYHRARQDLDSLVRKSLCWHIIAEFQTLISFSINYLSYYLTFSLISITCAFSGKQRSEEKCFFPTCQVRVVRFYQSCSPPPPPPLPPPPPHPPPPPRSPDPSGHSRTSTASSRSQWALPDLNRELQIAVALPDLNRDFQIAVGTAGPQPRAPDPSGHSRTSTASSRSQWALPDLNRDFQIAVGTAGPQPRLPDRSGHCRTSTARMSEKMPDRMSEDMSERMSEDMPDRMSEDMPERMSEDMPDRMSEDMPDKMPWDMPDRMPEDMPDRMPEDIPDRMPEDMPDRMPEGMPNRMPDKMSDRMPQNMPDRIPEDLPDNMPEDMPDRMPDRMPEDLPDRMPEDMLDRMPNRMSEDMSDRMPEDLPVRKCINVMVGITRSKVIFFDVRMYRMSRPAFTIKTQVLRIRQ